jgi:serine/threonine protein phosphatase PrpC
LTGQSTTPVPRSEEGTSGDDINVTLAAQQKVSPVPDITIVNRSNEADRLIVLACDGVWDVVNNLECSSIIGALLAEGEANMGLIGEELIDVCLKKGSRLNMTAIVVRFPGQTIGEGGGVAKRRMKREVYNNKPRGPLL